jgi:hypothetical protein
MTPALAPNLLRAAFRRPLALAASQTTWKHTLQAFRPAAQVAEVADGTATVIPALDDKATDGQLAGYAHLVT